MSDADLRIRLEGRLEELEREQQLLAQLDRLATPKWRDDVASVVLAVEAYQAHAERVAEVRVSLLKEPRARRWLDDIAQRETALCAKLDRLCRGTAVVRKRGLEDRLTTWADLARSFGPVQGEAPLASGEGLIRSREWMATLGAGGLVVLAGQPLMLLLLAPLGLVWWDFCKVPVKWRLFKDCIEVTEPDVPVRRIPLASIEAFDDQRLRALWDVPLAGEQGFFQFAAEVRRALSERDVRARYSDRPQPAVWLPATVHYGDGTWIHAGHVLECARGVVFVPDGQVGVAWFSAVGAPAFEGQADVGAELRALPKALLEDAFERLSELAGGSYTVSGRPRDAYRTTADALEVKLVGPHVLRVQCSPEVQAQLVAMHAR